MGLIIASNGVMTRGELWSSHLFPSLRDWLPWAVLSPLLFRFGTRLPLERGRLKSRVPLHLVCCVAIPLGVELWKQNFHPHERGSDRPPDGALHGAPGGAPQGRTADEHGHDGPSHRGGSPRGGFFNPWHLLGQDLPIYLMILSGAHALLYFRRDQERAAALAQARLEALRSQLQPHFLFNTLNTICGLVHDEPDKADAMIVALSDLLRFSLESSHTLELPLAREMEFVERYLALMQARFEERLQYEIEVAPGVEGALVPPMLLYPLIHLLVDHGVQHGAKGGCVKVRAWGDGERLRLAVEDGGEGVPAGSAEIETARLRLHELYGPLATLSASYANGCVIEISLPLHTTLLPFKNGDA